MAGYRLPHFGLADMIRLGAAVRQIGLGAASMEEVAERIVGVFRREFADDDGPQFPLVRFYKTESFADLDDDLRAYALAHAGYEVEPDTRCLTLLATAGEREEWNSRFTSRGHRTIPLPSVEMLDQLPMVGQLVRQFGLDVNQFLLSDPELMVDLDQRQYNVFHVPVARGSAHVPAQDFVDEAGVQSVLGFGGMLPSGDLFALIVFSRVPIPREIAEVFRVVALSVKVAILPFAGGPVFRRRGAPTVAETLGGEPR